MTNYERYLSPKGEFLRTHRAGPTVLSVLFLLLGESPFFRHV